MTSPAVPFALSLISLCLIYIGVALLPLDIDMSIQIAAGVALGANAYLSVWHGIYWLVWRGHL